MPTTKQWSKTKKNIQPGTSIKVGRANKGKLSQTGKGKLPFDNVPEGTEEVNICKNIHSMLLSGDNFFKEGKYTLVFGPKNWGYGQGKKRIISKGNNETVQIRL